jgi:putative transposase
MSIAPTMASPHGSFLRKGRASVPGQIYLVTSVTKDRRKLFLDFDLGCLASKILNSHQLWPDANLLAWVLMPDHMHLLVELGDRESLALVVQRVKSLVARELRQSLGPEQIWQSGFHDHALRDSEDVIAVARYVIANPLRAGLAKGVGEYPFWGSAWLDAQADPLDG